MKPQRQRTLAATLLAILVLGLVGTAIELVLLGHDESFSQLVPFILIGVGLAALGWHALRGSRWSLQLVRATMLGLIASGLIGIALHYRGNVEFQKEVDPSIEGLSLFKKAIASKTPPALAPGALAQLGLLGLVCANLLSNRREEL